VNLYAPSGTARREDREFFFNAELPDLLYTASHSMIIGGDFNCVLQPVDTTGHFSTSRALAEIVRGLTLTDAWKQDPRRPSFTHHSPTSATRIDRFYVTQDLLDRKTGIEILPAAFTDHEAVVLRLSIPNFERKRRRGRWKMDPSLVSEVYVKDKIRVAWVRWRRSRQYYDDDISWWERCVKPQLQRLLRQEEAERRANYRNMENHLHGCIYIMRSTAQATERFNALQRYMAKLVRLHAVWKSKILLDITEKDKLDDEEPSLFHVLGLRRRRAAPEIRLVTDLQGNTHTMPSGIVTTFVTHLSNKYKPIDVESSIDTLREVIPPSVPDNVCCVIGATYHLRGAYRGDASWRSAEDPGN
jgi:hypothetical protein